MITDLKPYPKYKESDVDWLGEVPVHWEVRRIKTLFRETDERIGEGGGLLLSLTRARGIVPQAEASNRIAGVEDLSKYKVCKFGYLIMNRMQAWSGMFAVSGMEGVISPDYSVFQPTAAIEVHYFEALFKTPVLVDEFAKRSKGIGSGFNRLYTPDFGAVPVISPPLSEQTAIVRFLDWAERRIRQVIRAREKRIKLLEEYKQALIHQAVTGRTDVRTGKPYPKYKDSGVEWLGEVPEHWEVVRIKFVARLKSGESITAERIEENGAFPVYGGNGLRGFTSAYTHEGEFVLIGRQGALCGNINYASGRFWASEHAVVAHPLQDIAVRWFGELLRSMNLNQYSIAAAQPGLAVERIQNLPIPLPPIPEQCTIAEYLERQTASIDAAIAADRRAIDLLKEFRTRLIADVVTGKLDVREAAAKLPDDLPEEEAAEDDKVAGETDVEVESEETLS